MNRAELTEALNMKKSKGEFITAAGVDSAETERVCTQAGSDLILLYPTSHYHNARNRFIAGFMALGNTNKMMYKAAQELMPLLKSRTILAGVNASDPFKLDKVLLKRLRDQHFTGIHNYPTMALVDGEFGSNIAASGFGFEKEIDFFRMARQEGFFTCAMVQTMKQAIQMATVPADMIVFYLGLGERKTSHEKGSVYCLEKDVQKLKSLVSGVRKVNSDILLLFYSERLSTVEEIRRVAEEIPDIDGYCFLSVAMKDSITESMGILMENIKRIRKWQV